jgi:predicted nucleic acid-binding protein
VILADTSIWADHLRADDTMLMALLDAGQILIHPFVIGEIALGHLRQRDLILLGLKKLPYAPRATDDEVLHLINSRGLMATGIGYVDAHLLAAVRLSPGVGLWTRDKRLHAVAERLGFAATPNHGTLP